MKLKRFLSFLNLQRKLQFIKTSAHRGLVDLYFRNDHFDYQEKIRVAEKCEPLTKQTILNLVNLIIIILKVPLILFGARKKDFNNFFDNIEFEYTKIIMKYIHNNGCKEIHSLAYNSMRFIKPLARNHFEPAITTYEYQHGLILWDLFELHSTPPHYFVCASNEDIYFAKNKMSGTKWESDCKLIKSEIVRNYVYGSTLANARSSVNLWDGEAISYIHSPIYIKTIDISIIIFETIIAVAKKHSVLVKIYPHPSSLKYFKKNIHRSYVSKEKPSKKDLILGFFSSKMIKCLQEGFNVLQIDHENNDYPFQRIPKINTITIGKLENHILSLKKGERNDKD